MTIIESTKMKKYNYSLKEKIMKYILPVLFTIMAASASNASIYKCDISSPIDKTLEVWTFTFDTNKEYNKFIDLGIEQQSIAGCASLKASKTYLTCGIGSRSTKNSVFSTIEDGTPILSLAIRIADSQTLMSCVKQ